MSASILLKKRENFGGQLVSARDWKELGTWQTEEANEKGKNRMKLEKRPEPDYASLKARVRSLDYILFPA